MFCKQRKKITTASIELYEGKTQSNSTVWSSLNSPPSPLVERQTFIISSGVAAMRETITEKGITNKHVLSKSHTIDYTESLHLQEFHNSINNLLISPLLSHNSWPQHRLNRWNGMDASRSTPSSAHPARQASRGRNRSLHSRTATAAWDNDQL